MKISEKINDYSDICRELGISGSGIRIEIEGFSFLETSVLENVAKAMQIAKVYNQGWFPKEGDNRYYAWWYIDNSSPSGLRFAGTNYGDGAVRAASAAHLCFKTREDAEDAAKKFIHIYAGFVWPKNTPATFSERKIDMKILLCKSRR